jgi:hypothetical protein
MVWRIIGGLAVVVVSFFGTLLLMDSFDTPDSLDSIDRVRAGHARSIKAALASYKAKRGNYPFPFAGSPLSDLKKELVDGGFLPAIPFDPGDLPDKRYRYIAPDGTAYGLLFHVQPRDGKNPADSTCITGVEPAGGRWWGGSPPPCPF